MVYHPDESYQFVQDTWVATIETNDLGRICEESQDYQDLKYLEVILEKWLKDCEMPAEQETLMNE